MELKEKSEALTKLLSQDGTTLFKIEQAVGLFKGLDPRLDGKIGPILRHLSNVRNLQEGDVIELSVENLPESSEKEKKRKRALVFLLKSIRELRSEVKRIQSEWERQKRGEQTSAQSQANTLAFVKGPFGIITLVAAAVVLGFLLFGRGKTQTQSSSVLASSSPTPSAIISASPTPSPKVTPSPTSGAKIQVITFGGKKIPLAQLAVRTGPDCTNSPTEATHYHAANGQYVVAVDGTQINDPGGCAFGKVSETEVSEISPPDNASPTEFDRTAY